MNIVDEQADLGNREDPKFKVERFLDYLQFYLHRLSLLKQQFNDINRLNLLSKYQSGNACRSFII